MHKCYFILLIIIDPIVFQAKHASGESLFYECLRVVCVRVCVSALLQTSITQTHICLNEWRAKPQKSPNLLLILILMESLVTFLIKCCNDALKV